MPRDTYEQQEQKYRKANSGKGGEYKLDPSTGKYVHKNDYIGPSSRATIGKRLGSKPKKRKRTARKR